MRNANALRAASSCSGPRPTACPRANVDVDRRRRVGNGCVARNASQRPSCSSSFAPLDERRELLVLRDRGGVEQLDATGLPSARRRCIVREHRLRIDLLIEQREHRHVELLRPAARACSTRASARGVSNVNFTAVLEHAAGRALRAGGNLDRDTSSPAGTGPRDRTGSCACRSSASLPFGVRRQLHRLVAAASSCDVTATIGWLNVTRQLGRERHLALGHAAQHACRSLPVIVRRRAAAAATTRGGGNVALDRRCRCAAAAATSAAARTPACRPASVLDRLRARQQLPRPRRRRASSPARASCRSNAGAPCLPLRHAQVEAGRQVLRLDEHLIARSATRRAARGRRRRLATARRDDERAQRHRSRRTSDSNASTNSLRRARTRNAPPHVSRYAAIWCPTIARSALDRAEFPKDCARMSEPSRRAAGRGRALHPREQVAARADGGVLILGCLLSVILAGANAYLGMFAGMTVSASVPAAVISMGIFRALRTRQHPPEQRGADRRRVRRRPRRRRRSSRCPRSCMLGVWTRLLVSSRPR